MARLAAVPVPDFRQALLETYAVNDRMNQLLLEHLTPPRVASQTSRPQGMQHRCNLRSRP